MKTEDLIPHEFFRQFKTGEELNNFLKSIQKCGIEKMLEGKLDTYLDYDKQSHRKRIIAVMGILRRPSKPIMIMTRLKSLEIAMLAIIL